MQTLNFSHDKNSTCLSPASFSWFNSTAKVPLSSLSLLSKVREKKRVVTCKFDIFEIHITY